ncbi:hypothetical protein, partial [Prochlorothrix hollandica]|uniref:hypothetical protein n=1 Tax=Prochlorothrix hollandica TaxID=1223 RepID=UPI00333FA24F
VVVCVLFSFFSLLFSFFGACGGPPGPPPTTPRVSAVEILTTEFRVAVTETNLGVVEELCQDLQGKAVISDTERPSLLLQSLTERSSFSS